jgi:hypothetical protein
MSRYVLVGALAVLLAVDAVVGWDRPLNDSDGWTPLATITGYVHRAEDMEGFAEPGSFESANEVLDRYCMRCHSDRQKRGNLSLEGFDADHPETAPETAEMVIRKLRAGMMPPSGRRRPDANAMEAFISTMEDRIDAVAAEDPNPGFRTFQRLNRAEYERSVKALIGLDIDAGDYLPLDTKSANFDNIADVQMLSPTLLDAYLSAASEITRLAVGNANAAPSETTYPVSRYASQRERVPGAPFGTRGGVSVEHIFPADGEYVFRMSFQHESTGNFFGQTAPFDEMIEVSIDGEPVAVLDVDRWMHVQDPDGVEIRSEPIFITAGPKRLTAAFIKNFEGPQEDKLSPHDWSLADRKIGYSYGVTSLPHLRDLVVGGPYNATGVSDNEARQTIFTCHPARGDEASACARSIIGRVATRAFRRPLDDGDVSDLMALYDAGVADGGFEEGVRLALQGVLASPDFVFRFEEVADPVPGIENTYRLSDAAIASRLSYFLWAEPPDAHLLELADAGQLSDPEVLSRELERMLADPRVDALGTRFAAQWLRLQDLDKVHPDVLKYPDYDLQLAEAMKQETVELFNYLVAEDLSVLDLLTADYTFVNERLARHYGISGLAGDDFRRVEYADDRRRGILGHASVLTLTSHANTTSPVLRGKWVMEVLLGSPPPAPPPNVPELADAGEVEGGRVLTTKEQLERHRADPVCSACHIMMDPIGLALENFDVTGRWRIKDQGTDIVVEGELYDGLPLTGPDALREGLLQYQEAFVRAFTENLMAYALGRRVEYYDMPTVRALSEQSAESGYRVSSFIEGIVTSPAFLMQRVPDDIAEAEAAGELN